MTDLLICRPEYEMGQHVRNPRGDVGKIVNMVAVPMYKVEYPGGERSDHLETSLEPAPKLTPEEAWSQVAMIALRFCNNKAGRLPQYITSGEYKAMRAEAYRMLGRAGVSFNTRNDEGRANKQRVRNVLGQVFDMTNWYILPD